MLFRSILAPASAAILCFTLSAEDLTPHLAFVQIYGERKISVEKVDHALNVNPGGLLPPREDAEERVAKIPGVLETRIEAVCCVGKNLVMYVGVQDRESPRMDFHEVPTSDLTLPPSLFDSYRSFLNEVSDSIRGHNNDEDLTAGYSLMADPASRSIQQSFLAGVAADLPTVDRVVRESSDSEQRAAAAYLLQYAPRDEKASKMMTDGLQYALRDPDDAVRQNAMRALKAVMVGAKLHPEQPVHMEATWFVELMNSLVLSDRRDASEALVTMTEDRNQETLSVLRERALGSVVEMARWRQLQYALPAFILAGRMAGMDEKSIKTAWVNGERDDVLDELVHHRKHKTPGA